ncbi:DUF3054 domain-containing protein [Skermania sp. ID1734]|uniref:DUF3054 domain-containing protein n=1 Tax=Skermania sp. ID1734 TaxID=2597516 RepID=UPI00117C5995|nr:DUF3054 domain-containing protein [Skermania sp. ID1734]TSE00267.1 DUF3054 domain-containing protein [Skermania sp. ID1734]
MKKLLPAFAVDLVLVIIFCAIGRRSHEEANALGGLVHTAWPFVAGLIVGWAAVAAATRGAFDGSSLVPVGIAAWAGTLVGGMVLRVISGQGTAVTFIIVAGVVLAIFLIGWRIAATVLARRRAATR